MARIALVACAKQKQNEPAAAKDLYISQLFRGCRSWAENKSNADAWYILSARHGLVKPDEIISPYEFSLTTATQTQRKFWASKVVDQLLQLPHFLLPGDEIIFMAGRDYRDLLQQYLQAERPKLKFHVPMKGLGIGEQLAWLKRNLTWAP